MAVSEGLTKECVQVQLQKGVYTRPALIPRIVSNVALRLYSHPPCRPCGESCNSLASFVLPPTSVFAVVHFVWPCVASYAEWVTRRIPIVLLTVTATATATRSMLTTMLLLLAALRAPPIPPRTLACPPLLDAAVLLLSPPTSPFLLQVRAIFSCLAAITHPFLPSLGPALAFCSVNYPPCSLARSCFRHASLSFRRFITTSPL